MTATPPSQDFDHRTRITALRTQHGDGALGVPAGLIRLSWQVEAEDPDAFQAAYQLAVIGENEVVREELPVAGAQAAATAPGGPLGPGERRRFTVRVATQAGWSAWSAPTEVEAGVGGSDLLARVIGIESTPDGPVALLRREFQVSATPSRARLRLSAVGLVDAWINGRRASDALLTPGWTSYQERILVDTVDVTALLRTGPNVIVLAVADGWYRGSFGFARRTGIYGDRSGALAQLEVEGEVVVATDETWAGGFGAVRSASLYDGTVTDLRLHDSRMHEPGFNESGWRKATVVDIEMRRFEPRSAPPVRVIEERGMAVTLRSGAVQLDAGQNISGWVRLIVVGREGDIISVRHAEVLEPSGDLHTAALRSARATDQYVLDRDGRHELEPVFTFHGFRYAEVTGGKVVSATAVAISSDLAPRSSFASDHLALNRFHANVVWSLRDNFVSVPTDCPQRDERLGWTGDAQAFAPTAVTLVDSEAFWISWLRDLEIDQTDEGGVPSVVPDIIRPVDAVMGGKPIDNMGRAGWADAATIVPFAVYESYGSPEVLERQLDSMRRWVEHLRRRAGDGVVLPTEPFQYGDWLDPDAPADRPWEAKVSSDYVANAFYVRSARLLARAERLVGDPARGTAYDELAARVAAALWALWGEAAQTTQTGAALALEFDLAPRPRRRGIAAALAENVRREGGRIATGFLGTPLVLFALSRNGYLEEAYRMLLRRDAPSWLYQVDRGATTVWERWDAILPDGSIHSGAMDAEPSTESGGTAGSMLSFNHYAYGAVVDWVYRTVAGLAPDLDDPGYRTVVVAPRPCDRISHATASIDTPYGRCAIDWAVADNGVFRAQLDVPFGVRAVLDLPIGAASVATVDGAPAALELRHGSHLIEVTSPAIAGSGLEEQ